MSVTYGFPDEQIRASAAQQFKRVSTASTNAVSVVTGARILTGYYLSNTNSSPRYIKLYDKASAPTVGTDTPVRTFMIPPNSAANIALRHPLQFLLGIALAMTTGAADSDTGAVAANELIANLDYI